LAQITVSITTKRDELFAVIPDEKYDERTAKVFERNIANAGSSVSGGSSSDDTSARIQLPTKPLPRFNGDIGEWVYFRDKFTALITLNKTLTGFFIITGGRCRIAAIEQ
jgi:hypothetical protein